MLNRDTEIVKMLRATPPALHQLNRNLSPAEASWTPQPNERSAVEVVTHMDDADERASSASRRTRHGQGRDRGRAANSRASKRGVVNEDMSTATPTAADGRVPQPAGQVRHHESPDRPPGFRWWTQVFFDELNSAGMMHNARGLVLIERASSAFFEANGLQWQRDPADNPDQYYVVSQQTIRDRQPITGPNAIAVEMWVTRLGQTSVGLAFEIRSPHGSPVYAHAERVHVKLDPATAGPVPWTPRLREHLASVLRVTDPHEAGPRVPTAGPPRHAVQP